MDGQCFNHNCIATACLQDYHLYQNACEPDDENHCGKQTTNCSELIQGYATGECVEKECYVRTCVDGYHLDNPNNRCVADTNDCCGTSCSRCTSPRVCSKGACEAQCEAPLTKCNNECHNYSNDIDHCGGGNNSCTTAKVDYSTDVTCTDSTCKATSCQYGYHVWNGQCEKDTVDNCGAHGTQCNVGNVTEATCSEGVCQATACKSGYHIYNNACERDTTTNCGRYGTKCNIADAMNACIGGECTFVCNSDYHTYSNACEADSIENCGSHGNKCEAEEICSSGACSGEYTLCGGTQTNIFNNPSNCRGCGHHCETDEYCNIGVCGPLTDSTTLTCNGNLVYPSNDSVNCGKCGNRCSGYDSNILPVIDNGRYIESCVSGVCSGTFISSFTKKSTVMVSMLIFSTTPQTAVIATMSVTLNTPVEAGNVNMYMVQTPIMVVW